MIHDAIPKQVAIGRNWAQNWVYEANGRISNS